MKPKIMISTFRSIWINSLFPTYNTSSNYDKHVYKSLHKLFLYWRTNENNSKKFTKIVISFFRMFSQRDSQNLSLDKL
jgi:hypothetical protein